MTEHYKGQTIWVYATWTDKDDIAITGLTNDKHTIKVYDPNGADKTGTVTVSEVGSGIYYFKYQIAFNAVDGTWKVTWKVDVSGDTGIEEHAFEVK